MPAEALLLPLNKLRAVKRREDYKKIFVYKTDIFKYIAFVPNPDSFDIWPLQTYAEGRISAKLGSLAETVPSLEGVLNVPQNAMLWDSSWLPQDYRETEKATGSL